MTTQRPAQVQVTVSPTQYLNTVVLPPQIIQAYPNTTTTGGAIYKYNTQGKTITTTTTTTNTNYNNPKIVYYSKGGQYIQTQNNNNTVPYITNTYTQGQIAQNNIARKTVSGYEYKQIKETKPQIKPIQEPSLGNTEQKIIYTERKTNYPRTNNLNLQNIYNMNNVGVTNTNQINAVNNQKTNKVQYDYNFYNNNMYMVESSNKHQHAQKITQKQVDHNNYNYTQYINQQQNVQTNPKVNIVNYKNNANLTSNTNINSQAYITSNIQTKANNNIQTNAYINNKNNQNNAYLNNNNKIIINNKKNTTNNKITNYVGNTAQQTNNIYDGIIQEPPDNMKKRKRNNVDNFNNTMPNLKIKNDITGGQVVYTPTVQTIERKSNPLQPTSAVQISFNNTAPKIKPKTNNQLTTNNINTTKNIQNIQTPIINYTENAQNMEYKDNYGNIYVLINGQFINKKTLKYNNVNNTANINQQKNINTNITTNINQNQTINNNAYYKENKSSQEQISGNNAAYLDAYNIQTQKQNITNNEEIKYHNIQIKKLPPESNIQNTNQYNNYLNNTYPLQGQKVYKNEYLIDNNILQNQNQVIENQRDNRFKQEPNYTNINTININSNLDINYNANITQQQQLINDTLYKKTKSGTVGQNDILTVEPQKPKPKPRRPVYKIPPSKKRAVSQGRSLAFIHKYYDENFILEEDNEDNASDNENKKNPKNKLKNIFREVTNARKLLPKWQAMNNNNIEQNEVQNIDNEEQIKSNENENADNIDLIAQNINPNLEQNVNTMRLSNIRFSLEPTIIENNKDNNIDKNKDNNIDNNINIEKNKINIDNNIDMEDTKKTMNSDKNQNNAELNSTTKTASETISHSQSKENSEKLEKDISASINGPRNSDSLIKTNSLDNINIDIENKNSKEIFERIKNIDINSSTNIQEDVKNTNINMSSIVPNFMDQKDIMKDSILNNNNININQKEKEEERISLNIAGHDLDKYFKEGNKRDSKLGEVSTSLKTVNLEEDYKNSKLRETLEGEKKGKLANSLNSNLSNNLSRENSKDSGNLIMIDDALKGSVHLSGKIQDFVNKNNELYNEKDNNK